MQMSKYADVRRHMLPGDIIGFGGKGNTSDFIKWAIRSPVSHVGIVLQRCVCIRGTPELDQAGQPVSDRFFNEVIESTSLGGKSGVQINRISDRLHAYKGEVWWLPLHPDVRKRLEMDAYWNFLFAQEGKEYDTVQAIKSGIDINVLGKDWVYNDEDYAKFFCSELCAAALKAGGVIDTINASEVTPKDLVQFKLYKNVYHQISGECQEIKGYNTRGYEGFGV